MHILLLYEVVDDYASKRLPFREEHLRLANEATARGELLLGGALAEPLDSAILLFRGPTSTAAEQFVQNDPYVRNGLVSQWTIRSWNTVAGSYLKLET